MASSSSCRPTYRPGETAAAPPPPPLRVVAPSPWGRRARGSTAQVNLRKIIAIITTVLPPQPHPNASQSQLAPPPPPPPAPPPPVPLERGGGESRILSSPSGGHGIHIDLRLRLGPPRQMGRRNSPDDEEDHDGGLPSSACSFVGEGTTKVTGGGGGGSSGVAAPETAESGIVSTSYDGARGPGMLDSNSAEERSCEGEWDADGGRAEEEDVKEERAEEGGEEGDERGGIGGEGRPCSEITKIQGHTGGGGTEESDATTQGGVVVGPTEEVVVKKKSSKMDGDNEGDAGRRCRRRDEGYLGLLLEAVRQVSGGSLGDETPRNRKEEHAEEGRAEGSKMGGCWAAAFEEEQTLAPVVRSKRGRSQALPSRYRDSVLEPWRKQSGGGGSHLQRRRARNAP